MTAQSADAWSLFYPKPGWTERLSQFRFRVIYSAAETRVMAANLPRPSRAAYADYVEEQLNLKTAPGP